ncbi:SWI/SNF-related matrix-associated actin-dependentregulator of chromatin subfamily D member 1 [Striga asiatica]|uniref:SWI/SNF-related matrix-associated actin-dependentregulator of chromatin subfamily D member 1 n=1 Tax=Striga asiatica TaxID=4170 RepID=A0A5A7PGF8_STRAF|nr:SWI/SNF-related matrix-associated actin-dependentregulator of chromatin subfamily D member 1 [Striga asiatica]
MNNQNINNNNPRRGNFGLVNPSAMQIAMQMPMQIQMPANHNQQHVPHLLSQSQPQGRPFFPGHFQPSEPQAQAFVHDPSQAMAQAQAQVNTNIGISSPLMPTPGPGSGKRLPKAASRPSGGSSGQGNPSPMKTMELTPAVRRGKRKLPDEAIPEKVSAILPESALYTQLLEFESWVDAALARKKMDIIESLKNPLRAQKVLRIYIFNTYANQTGTNVEKESVEPPSWSLRIIGRILEDGRDPALQGLASSTSYPKFSSFFKKITVYLDQSLYTDNHVILWESSRSPVLHEGFEVKRKGDKEFTAIVRLEMNYAPEKFKLSPALQEVLGIEVETRSRIMTAFWHYIKMRKLQIPGETSSFMCDPPLRKIFGEEKLKFSMVPQKITPHLSPPGHIHLEHRIKLSGGSPVGNTCYDVLVDVPLVLEKEMSTFLTNLEKNKEIDSCDEAISSAVKKIHEHLRRRSFFLGFSQSPAEFINTLIASQARDLKLAAADATRDMEKERRAEFYNQPWAEDAVIRYLNRKPAVGSEVAGNK